MVTRKAVVKSLEGFDLEAFRNQKAAIEAASAHEISERIDQVKILLREIKDISDLSGIEVGWDEIGYCLNDVGSGDGYWNSSSC